MLFASAHIYKIRKVHVSCKGSCSVTSLREVIFRYIFVCIAVINKNVLFQDRNEPVNYEAET